MAVSATLYCLKRAAGLTLIEVLIALAIVGIAMTAVIKATSQTIRATYYLQDKTQAMWVGQNILNEARAGMLILSDTAEPNKESTFMLGHQWYWQAYQEQTPNLHIKRIKVDVFKNADEKAQPIFRLESYVYHQE